MTFFAVVGAFLLLGRELSVLMWRRSALPLWERITSAGVLGFAVWIGVSWTLAIAFRLTEGALQIAGLAAFVLAVALFLASRRGVRLPRPSREAWIVTAMVGLPLAGWAAYLLWRGWIAPPLAADALTYHLPRALMLARHNGYEYFPIPDTRVNGLPATYELLLSTFLLLQHTDTYTEWLSTLTYFLFLAAAAALVRRWWGGGRHVAVATLVVAVAPVLLLQGAAHKNDLLAGYFVVAALLFLGRWLRDGELPAAALSLIAMACVTGLKPHGAILGLLAVPVLLWGAFRRGRRPRAMQVAALVLLAILCVPLFGGYHYIYPRLHPPPGPPPLTAAQLYGAWDHLWQVPILIWLAPFSPDDNTVIVPWDDESWLWLRYDQFASNFGWLLSLLALAIPWVLWRDRERDDGEALLERRVITIAGGLLFVAILPTRFIPEGYVSSFPRYALHLIPIAAAWTVPPLLQLLSRRAPQGELLVLGLMAALFVTTGIRVADRDHWAPLSILFWITEHPGARWLPNLPLRAEYYVDAVAGPDEAIDVHGGDDTWIYPAYGAALRRDVRFINSPAEIRPGVKWVIVDRAFNGIWRDPRFKHIRQWRLLLGRGRPHLEDTAMIRALFDDPHWELRFFEERTVQAVFRRRTDGASTPRAGLPAPPPRAIIPAAPREHPPSSTHPS